MRTKPKTEPIHSSLDELNALLPDMAAAQTDSAVVKYLCFREGYGQRAFVDALELSRDRGIIGERWTKAPWLKLPDGQPDPRIQVCILSKQVLNAVWKSREISTHPGDTFVLDMNLSEANLPVGQLLQVGTAVLRVSDVFNDACVKWQARYGKTAKEWINAPHLRDLRPRGVLCEIAGGGIVRNGDIVTKIAPAGHL
ncbi:hypothetical protein [Cochlodiniinecator piscidefendens]|uniref:hypothetical protein n=1 Tax=Cochlodiniinecator piscidefendens TaxID=2715756 RepID=UPI002F41321F